MVLGLPFPMGVLYVGGIIVFIISGLYYAHVFEGNVSGRTEEEPPEGPIGQPSREGEQ